MKCYNCGHLLPDDSEFCQYCGKKIINELPLQDNTDEKNIVEPIGINENVEESSINVKKEAVHVISSVIEKNPQVEAVDESQENNIKKKYRTKFCKLCGGQIDDHTKKCSGCGKQYFKGIKFNKFLMTIIVLSAIILTSVIINIVQFVKIENLTDKVESQTSTISSQKSRIDILDKKSSYYDTICRELSYGNLGYASNNFRVSESVILVDKNEKDRKFTLTTSWSGSGKVSVSYSGYSAKVSFDNESWNNSTKMTVEPKMEGITVVKFSNDVNSQTFKMIIIVKN